MKSFIEMMNSEGPSFSSISLGGNISTFQTPIKSGSKVGLPRQKSFDFSDGSSTLLPLFIVRLES